MNTALAQELADAFYIAESGKLCVRDGASHFEAVRQMCMDAHDLVSWESSYTMVRDVLNMIAEDGENAREASDLNYDSLADAYSSDLVNWLADGLNNKAYADELLGQGNRYGDLDELATAAQLAAYYDIAKIVFRHFPDDEQEDED